MYFECMYIIHTIVIKINEIEIYILKNVKSKMTLQAYFIFYFLAIFPNILDICNFDAFEGLYKRNATSFDF